MKRRTFIRLAGGGVVVAASGAGLYRYGQQNVFPVPASATAAWREAGRQQDPRLFALSYAILAPNPHNMQPWIADLRRPGQIQIRIDGQRLLPETDPQGRQILMGLGCFLEILAMAAGKRGLAADTALFPDGVPGDRLDGRRMALITLRDEAAGVPDALLSAVLERRTDRRTYDGSRRVTQAQIATLAEAAAPLGVRFGVEAGGKLDAIKQIARSAWRTELTTPEPMMESMRLLRIGSREIDAHRDGIAIDSPLLVLLARSGLLDRTALPAPDSIAVTGQIAAFDEATATTPAYLWIVTEGNSRTQQVDAGRAYARVNLAATKLGLSMHPNSQCLQEYDAVRAQYEAIHALLDAPRPTHTVQMLARLGHPSMGAGTVAPTPRRGIDAHLA